MGKDCAMNIIELEKQGRIVTINGTKYYLRVDLCMREKVEKNQDYLGVKLGITVIKLNDDYSIQPDGIMNWQQLKGSYVGEKIKDFIKNTINGQASFYWDWKINPLKELQK